jgi:exodeoxyribonuclease VII small subunit
MVNKFSYDKAIAEIEQIIDEIENDALDVDKLSEKVKKATTLIQQCKKKLSDTKAEVDNLLNYLE